MEKIVASFLIIVLIFSAFWRYILDAYLFIVVPTKYNLKGEMRIIEEKYENTLNSVSWKVFSVEIKNGEELTILPLDLYTYTKLKSYINTKRPCVLSCKKFAWKKLPKIIEIN